MSERGLIPTDVSLIRDPSRPVVHRDVSWLLFNDRVLAEANDTNNPLLERLKFLAISSSNLDEFFMIRFGSIGRAILAAAKDASSDGRLPNIESTVLGSVAAFGRKQMRTLEDLQPELEKVGISIVLDFKTETPEWHAARKIFEEQVLPALGTPESFSPGAVAGLQNLELGALVGDDLWFKIPASLPLVLSHHDEAEKRTYFFLLDELLMAFLGKSFTPAKAPIIFRVTRDGDFSIDLEDSDPESIPDVVRSGLSRRDKGKPVRLQIFRSTTRTASLSEERLDQILKALKISALQCFDSRHSLLLHGLWTVVGINDAMVPQSKDKAIQLRYPTLDNYVPAPFSYRDSRIFDALKSRDLLLHHPYDSFDSYVAFIEAACKDPDVTSIEQTVYRVDAASPVIQALVNVAHQKKIRIVIELRARFDESNNLKLADELRKAGVEVGFGFGKLKLHAKVALVTRREGNQSKHYTHLSTGNYKAATARQYTDLAIVTSHEGVGADARKFFDSVMKKEIPSGFNFLVAAPTRLHRRLLSHIKAETEAARQGRSARIFAKVNALVDETVVGHLYEASQAGVQVDLVVRGACSLVPNIKGLSENIRVKSIVDRFLEHSRIYYFENSGTMYLSSADWMPRNFFSRLELAFPVLDPRIYRYIQEILIPTYLSDNAKACNLNNRGLWERCGADLDVPNSLRVRSQFVFERLAGQHYEGTVLAESDIMTAGTSGGPVEFLRVSAPVDVGSGASFS